MNLIRKTISCSLPKRMHFCARKRSCRARRHVPTLAILSEWSAAPGVLNGYVLLPIDIEHIPCYEFNYVSFFKVDGLDRPLIIAPAQRSPGRVPRLKRSRGNCKGTTVGVLHAVLLDLSIGARPRRGSSRDSKLNDIKEIAAKNTGRVRNNR